MSRGFTFEHSIHLPDQRHTGSSRDGRRSSLEILRSHLDKADPEYEYFFEYKRPKYSNFRYGKSLKS